MAMIRPETEMKDAGIDWIGIIPNNWNIKPLYACLDEINQKNSPVVTTNILSLTNTDGVIPYSERGNQGNKSKENFEEYKVVYPNTIVANSMNILIGSVGLSQYEGCVSPVYYVYAAKPQVDIRYMNYLFQMEPFQKRLRQFANGILEIRLRVSSHDILHQKVAVPDYDEQQAIADYLDETCSKIDEIIAEAKASIDEYKELKQSVIDKAVLHGLCNGMMKDSGNDLIGKIPLSWEMRKLKYVADFNPGITTAYDAQKEVGYVPMNCVKNGYMNPLSARLSDMSTGLTGFQDGDIVIAKVTPCFENGNIAVAENLEQGVAFGSSELFVIRTHSINRRFMLYYLQNSVFKNQCISTMTGTGGLKRVSGYFVNNAYITYPPENEQQVIVNYLDEAVKNMDFLIAEKESLINDLEAYKKSLIYEVVTGKRRVV